MSKVYKGSCFCGTVSYQISGPPILTAYCHCTNCQKLAGAPYIHTLHFPSERFTWTHQHANDDVLDSYIPPAKPYKTRYRCKKCGVTVTTKNSLADKNTILGTHLERDVKGVLVDWEDLKPTAHIFYDTRVVDINDELGKWTGYENQSQKMEGL